jgi:hypothetical protein
MLRDNAEPEFASINNKKMFYDQLLLELRQCGILICPVEEDITSVGLKVKVM